MTTTVYPVKVNTKLVTNLRRTTCKLCWHSLLYTQPAVWLTNPMGLSHTVCAERERRTP